MDQNNSPVSIEDPISVEKNISLEKSTKRLRNSLILSFLFITIMAAIFSAQTYAYFWDNSKAEENRIIAGHLNVEFLEVSDTEDQTTVSAPIKFMPGTRVEKNVTILNSGNLPIYVRIKIEKTIINLENEMPEGWEELISCNINPDGSSENWIYRDGYYYYHTKVEPNSVTSALFDEIYFSELIGNEFMGKSVEFKIICEATQSNGNTSSPLTASGWPVTND